MIESDIPTGLALVCDQAGTVLRVVRDEVGGATPILAGRPFPTSVDLDSMQKALNFLAEIRSEGAAFNWVLNVPVDGAVSSFHFAGGMADDAILLVGARSQADTIRLYEELMRINNDQVNSMRQMLKEQSLEARRRAEEDSDLYEELSRLNNELANTQRELSKKNAELGRLNDLKNQFLGMAAHDLRTPLSIILTYSEFVSEEAGGVLTAEQMGFMETIQQSSEFMLGLVNDLLDIAKIETGKLELDLAPTALGKLVERNVTLNRVLAEKRGVALRLASRGDAAERMMLDASKIEQVLNNIIGNAIKFSPAGGTVDVVFEGSAHEARISVRDEGPGIPADELERLFRPFEQGRLRSMEHAKGAGLGLAIAKRIVEGHGGDITVSSAVGEGSSFTIILPVHNFEHR